MAKEEEGFFNFILQKDKDYSAILKEFFCQKYPKTRPIGLIDVIELGFNSPSIVLINSPFKVLQ